MKTLHDWLTCRGRVRRLHLVLFTSHITVGDCGHTPLGIVEDGDVVFDAELRDLAAYLEERDPLFWEGLEMAKDDLLCHVIGAIRASDWAALPDDQDFVAPGAEQDFIAELLCSVKGGGR